MAVEVNAEVITWRGLGGLVCGCTWGQWWDSQLGNHEGRSNPGLRLVCSKVVWRCECSVLRPRL